MSKLSKPLNLTADVIGQVDLGKTRSPDTDVAPNDHVAGVMSEDLRQIYGAHGAMLAQAQALSKRLQHMAINHADEPEPPPGFRDGEKELALLVAKLTVLKELLWSSVRHEFPALATKEVVGVRKVWKVVWADQNEPPLLDMLKKLFGG